MLNLNKKKTEYKYIHFFVCYSFADIDYQITEKKITRSYTIFSNLLLKNTQLASIGVNFYIKSLLKYKKYENYYSFSSKLKKKKNMHLSELRKNSNYLAYFTALACKRGFKLKTLKIVKNSFKLFFELFLFCNDDFFFKKYYYFSILKSYSQSWRNFFGINYFLNLFLPFYESIFVLRCVKLNKKKLKKKTTGDYKLDITYLFKRKRLNNVVKMIYFTTGCYSRYNFSDKLFCSLVDTFLLLTKSKVYQLKIEAYKKIMSLRRTASLSSNI